MTHPAVRNLPDPLRCPARFVQASAPKGPLILMRSALTASLSGAQGGLLQALPGRRLPAVKL